MEGLGLNLKGLLFQAGNFIVLFAILSFLFHKFFLGFIDRRSAEIARSLETAEKIKKDAAAAQDEQRALIQEARREAGVLLAEAGRQAKELEERVADQAAAQAEALLQRAQKQIDLERSQLKEQLRGELGELVIKASEKVLGQHVPESAKEHRISALVKELL